MLHVCLSQDFRNCYAYSTVRTEQISTRAACEIIQLNFNLLVLSFSTALNFPEIKHYDAHISVYVNVMVSCGRGMENLNHA
jgi:hypothetical protein